MATEQPSSTVVHKKKVLRKIDPNKQGFQQVLRTGGRGILKFFIFLFFVGWGGGLSQYMGYMGRAWGDFKEKRKYFNICTVACRLKNFIFLLN